MAPKKKTEVVPNPSIGAAIFCCDVKWQIRKKKKRKFDLCTLKINLAMFSYYATRGAKGRPPKSKEKPKLRTPTILKIKLPVKNLTRTIQNVKSPSSSVLYKRPKDLSSNDKLELTNAVARAQLNKSEPVVFSPQPEPEPKNKAKVVKRRGKKKKVEEEANNLLDAKHEPESAEPVCTDSEEVNLQPPKKKRVRKTPIKPVNKKMSVTKAEKMLEQLDLNQITKTARAPLKRKLVNAKDENKNPPKKKWMQSKVTEMKILLRRSSKTSSNGDNSRTVTLEKPKIVRKRGRRGKKKAEKLTEPVQELPSQSGHDINCVIKNEDDDNKYMKNANSIDSRKTSVTSELSWTKDISDSSNTTSMTAVTSSDFVLIDRKLPGINLTKIDSRAEYKQKIPDIMPKPQEMMPTTPDIMPKPQEMMPTTPDIMPTTPDIMPKPQEMIPTTPEFSPKTPSDSSSSSSDSDSSDSESSSDSDIGSRHSLNLSVSSGSRRSPIITQNNININTMDSNVTKISKALDKLSMSLKKIDLEMINWVGYQNEDININGKKVRDKIYQNLKEESEVIIQCRHINKLLTDNEEITNNEANVTENVESKINEPFVKPTDVFVPKTLNKTSDPTNFDKGNHSRDQFDYNDSKCESNNALYTSFDQYNDDEDALSLYAESIGFESNRNSISSPPFFNEEIEEYIPQPVTRNVQPTNTIVYNPTKISDAQIPNPNETIQNVRPVATVCEKQNADSTSVVREMSQDVNGRKEGIEKLPEATVVRKVDAKTKAGPCLLASIFKPAPGVKSVVFKGMCFFHLIASCKNQSRCRFPHVEPSHVDIISKLVRLSEDLFIHEYMLLKCWPMLRRRFGIYFVNECKRRDLTRLLVEMAIDFVSKANPNSQEDATLKVHVLEEALLYLNNINLTTCEDLLKYVVINGKELCELFMETIANTQNFSRFKPVFIKLTEFMIGNEKAFDLEVASHILERVAILPFNDSLAWALISIIKHTEAAIFENSMMGQFEKQLCSNEGLQREFLSVKEMVGVGQPVGDPSYAGVTLRAEDRAVTSPLYSDGVQQSPLYSDGIQQSPLYSDGVQRSPLYSDGIQRYTSPDTTNLDSLNKPPDEPTVIRNINFDRTFQNHSSSSSEGTEEYPRAPKPNSLFNSWRHKTIFNKFSPQGYTLKKRNDRQVTYGCSPSKFPKRQGPDFF